MPVKSTMRRAASLEESDGNLVDTSEPREDIFLDSRMSDGGLRRNGA